MIRLHIWWANLCHAVYEVCHRPLDDSWDKVLHEMNVNTKAERDAGVEWKNGHAYITTWQGRVHWSKCSGVHESEAVK